MDALSHNSAWMTELDSTECCPQGEGHGCPESQFVRIDELDDRQVARRAKAMDGLSHKTEPQRGTPGSCSASAEFARSHGKKKSGHKVYGVR